MKHHLRFAVGPLLAAALLLSGDLFAANTDDDLIQFERNRIAAFAKGDKTTFDQMVSDDATFTHGFGKVLDKKQEIALMSVPPPHVSLPTLSVEAPKVRAYGDAAVMTGHLVETTKDGRRESVLCFTNTYLKRNGGWRLVAGQLTPQARERPVAKVDPKVYADYVGTYKNPSGRILTISQAGENLMAESDTGKVALFPAAENQFFPKEADILFVFVKDETGRVVKLIIRRQNGDVVEEMRVA